MVAIKVDGMKEEKLPWVAALYPLLLQGQENLMSVHTYEYEGSNWEHERVTMGTNLLWTVQL